MKREILKITISVDDVNPSKNFRILGTEKEYWFKHLNDEFGAVFNLFIPSNYHATQKLSKNKTWLKELNDIPYFKCETHGHYHQTSDPKRFGECEFLELDSVQTTDRISLMWEEWDSVDIIPRGFRPPGWLMNSESKQALNEFKVNIRPSLWDEPWIEYVALHYEHNHGMKWNCKEFFGHDGIQQENISIHNGDMIMFQSHIAGNWNHNGWNEQNYEQLRLSLSHLVENYECEFKTLNQCL